MFWPTKMSHSFIQKLLLYNTITASFTTSRMNSWTLSLHWSCLCWRCQVPSLCLISSLPSMPLLLYWASLSWPKTTPKRGCRWPVVDNPHRLRLTCCPSHNWSSTAQVAHQGRRSWGWRGSDPQKICRKGRSMFWPLKMSILSFKTVVV